MHGREIHDRCFEIGTSLVHFDIEGENDADLSEIPAEVSPRNRDQVAYTGKVEVFFKTRIGDQSMSLGMARCSEYIR